MGGVDNRLVEFEVEGLSRGRGSCPRKECVAGVLYIGKGRVCMMWSVKECLLTWQGASG